MGWGYTGEREMGKGRFEGKLVSVNLKYAVTVTAVCEAGLCEEAENSLCRRLTSLRTAATDTHGLPNLLIMLLYMYVCMCGQTAARHRPLHNA